MQIVGGRWEVCLGDGSCVLFFYFPLSRVFSSLYDGPYTQPVLFRFRTPPASDVHPENTDLRASPHTQ